jgi:hypothetical protein
MTKRLSDTQRFGVRWQAKRDTAMDLAATYNPKRRRRFALPAHSKVQANWTASDHLAFVPSKSSNA